MKLAVNNIAVCIKTQVIIKLSSTVNPLQRDELRKNYEMLNFCILKQERENKRVSLQVDVSAFQLQTDCSWVARKQGLFSAFKRNDIQFMRLGIFVDN